MTVTLDWLGCATYRLTVGDLVVFLDAYMDRPEKSPPVGLTTAEVGRADWVLVGHSHWDHLWGAQTIARNTGARVAGSYETVRVLHDQEAIPEEQLLPVTGGDLIALGEGVTARAFPALHSCIWSTSGATVDAECSGDLAVPVQRWRERLQARMARRMGRTVPWAGQRPRGDGGALSYLIETPEGSIFWQDSMGYWTGVLRDIHPDVAILAAAGRGNVDGEPVQGSVASFVGDEVELLRPRRVVLNHYDDFAGAGRPTYDDLSPIRQELARRAPNTEMVEMGYMEAYPILRFERMSE